MCNQRLAGQSHPLLQSASFASMRKIVQRGDLHANRLRLTPSPLPQAGLNREFDSHANRLFNSICIFADTRPAREGTGLPFRDNFT